MSPSHTLPGIVPIVVTPFDSRDQVDVPSLHRLIDDYCANGVAGIVVPAVASEVDKLTPAECDLLIHEAVRATDGRVPVIGGVLAETGPDAARAAEHAIDAGASGILCRAPAKVVAADLRTYFTEASRVGTDFLVVQDLAWNDYGLDLPVLLDLCDRLDGLRAIKIEVARTGHKASQVLRATGGRVGVWSGWALPQMIETLDRGVHTYNPSAFNAPFVRVLQMYEQGERTGAEQLFERLLPYLAWSRQHIDINLHLIKRYCVRKGLFTTHSMREPATPYDEYHQRIGEELIPRMLKWERHDEEE